MNRRSLLGRFLAFLGGAAAVKAESPGGLPHEYKAGIDLAPDASQAQRTCWEMTDNMLIAAPDRLWVGPERQADLERVSQSRLLHGLGNLKVHRSPEFNIDIVLGVDGRWRWTQDLGIPPR